MTGSVPTDPGFGSVPRGAVVVLYLLLFFSGVAALTYEIAWAKMLALTFGSTTTSAAAVIAGFMGGMGIGAWLYHFVSDRWPYPLLIYGALEIGIAVTTAAFTLPLYSLPQVLTEASSLLRITGPGPALTLLQFVAVVIPLLFPAALMGATFPALCTALIRTAPGVDRHLGMIYGINTIGAAAGVLFAGLFLIERLGLNASVSVANVLNLLVGCTAIALARTRTERAGSPARKGAETTVPTKLSRRATGIVLFASGFATLGYEIVWFRASRYVFGNSTHALSAVLFVFLVGLGLGSLLLRRVVRRGSPERDLALCQCTIAVLAVGGMACQSLLLSTAMIGDAISVFSETAVYRPWLWRLLIQIGVATATMLPATLLMGLSFPLASRLFLGDVRKLGKRVGGAYLLANLGSILGAVAGATLLLPVFGTFGSTKVLAVINLSLAVVVVAGVRVRVKAVVPHLFTAAIVVLGLALVLPRSPDFRGETPDDADYDVVYLEEADLATVQVLEDTSNSARKSMAIDGWGIGYGSGLVGLPIHRKQLLLAHLPMVLDTRIQQTLNIGLGCGSTLEALASYAELETLDCVEINGAVVRACRLFEESSVLDDPRTRLVVDDAVHYLLQSDRSYDLIISDGKQQPSYSGNAVLLCQEFYRYSLARLSEHGLFVQWIPLPMLSGDFRVNLRTICDVFPHVGIFYFPRWSVMMVASRQPLAGRPRMSVERFKESRAYQDLRPYFIDHPTALLSHWTAGKPQLLRVLGEGPISKWDHLVLDFTAFKATRREWSRAKFDNLTLLLTAETMPGPDTSTFLGLGNDPFMRSSRLLRHTFAEYFRERFGPARVLAERAVAANPEDRDAQAVLQHLRIREQESPRGKR